MTTSPAYNVFIYMSAQNELSHAAEQNLKDIEGSTPLKGICLYVLLDKVKSEYEKTTSIYEVPANATLEQFRRSRKTAAVDKEVSNPEVFRSRLVAANNHFEDCSARKPLGQRILVLWGHGGGLVLLDEQQKKGAEVARARIVDFANVLAGEDAEGRFEIVAFDSCYMGLLETMYELKGCALYTLSSSTMVDSQGLPYGDIFDHLRKAEDHGNPRSTAEAIRRLYDHRYKDIYPDGSRSLLMCDLSKINRAGELLNALGSSLANLMQSNDADDPVRLAIRDALICAGAEADYTFCLPFLQLLEVMLPGRIPEASNLVVMKAIADLRQAALEAFSISDDSDVPSHSPIIWAPLSRLKFEKMTSDYNALKLSLRGKGGWAGLWRRFHGRPGDDITVTPGSPSIGQPALNGFLQELAK